MSRNPTEPLYVRTMMRRFHRSVIDLRTSIDLRNLHGERRAAVRDLVWRARELQADTARMLGWWPEEDDTDRAAKAAHDRVWKQCRDAQRRADQAGADADLEWVSVRAGDLRTVLFDHYR